MTLDFQKIYHSGPQSFAYLGGGTHFSEASKMREGHWHILTSAMFHLKYFASNLLFKTHNHPVAVELFFLLYKKRTEAREHSVNLY